MQLSALSLAITRLGRVPAYSPLALFTGTTTGAWYDPSDINLTWRRNLLTYSEQFDNAVWTKLGSFTTVNADAAQSPYGNLTADKLSNNTATTTDHPLRYSITWVGGREYTALCWMKAAELSYGYIRALSNNSSGSEAWCIFNLSNGTVTAQNGGVYGSVVESIGSWHLCKMQWVSLLTPSANLFDIGVTGSGSSIVSQIPAIGDGIYIWGAQLELGSTATPYQRITDGVQDYLQYQAQPVLYQDAAGTLPVTAVEQPVGLMLDKSKGLVLGPELVANPGPFINATNWTAVSSALSTASGDLVITGNGTGYPAARTTIATVVGVTYKLRFVANQISSGNATNIWIGTSAGGSQLFQKLVSTPSETVAYFTATGTTTHIQIVNNLQTASDLAAVGIASVRELPGNHAFNSSGNSANFPVLSARYNLLTKTEDFSDAAWATLGTVIRTPNYAVAPDGTTTAQRVVFSQNSSSDQFFQVVSVTSTTYSQGVWIKVPSGSALIKFGFYDGAIKTSALTLTTTWQYFTATQLLTAGAGARLMWLYPDGAGYATEIYVWHPDVRVSNDALNQPAYQRVNTATDYDTVGFKPYLKFNGTNQWLQTNSIDFSATDKMFVSAGVRKLSDAASGALLELSSNANTNGGAFWMFYPGDRSGIVSYDWTSKGSLRSDVFGSSSAYVAPVTGVLSGVGDISGDKSIFRINSTQVGSNTTDQGTGNYGNYPMFVGARAGTSLWFSGRLYQMVVAGKQASAAEITSTETYLNQKTGAY